MWASMQLHIVQTYIFTRNIYTSICICFIHYIYTSSCAPIFKCATLLTLAQEKQAGKRSINGKLEQVFNRNYPINKFKYYFLINKI